MRGILNINKPKNFTSFDVIAKLRKILNIKKIGHAGTLVPLATGVLPVFVGNATRLIQFVPKTKSYRAYARLGIETNTYDAEGEIISQKIIQYDLDNIKEILNSFVGKQLQTPPIYSAISVNGKRLYEYARKNQEVEIPKKEIEIFDIKVVDFDTSTEFPLLTFDINCASGVYVRSIIHDLGEKLLSGAMMENLTRTMSANLYLENSINLEDITKDNAQNYFINPNDMIDLPFVELDEKNFEKIKMGQYIFTQNNFKENEYIKLLRDNILIGIGIFKEK
ncbi:MAG: tRNA pseudouridine(55) synthase TruB, partial [Candidatus Gastranaerophilales bacterium]|nr:tRNA pseudouridine(55) synthase TruB [Candidatus Gastranaerophilales bacterium]